MTQNNISTWCFIILIYFVQTCVHHVNATYHLSHYLVNILVFHISFTDKDLVKTLAWVCLSVAQFPSHILCSLSRKTTTLGKLIVQPRTYQLTLTTSPDCVCLVIDRTFNRLSCGAAAKLNTWTNANSGWGPFKQTTITNGTRLSLEDAHWRHLFV